MTELVRDKQTNKKDKKATEKENLLLMQGYLLWLEDQDGMLQAPLMCVCHKRKMPTW